MEVESSQANPAQSHLMILFRSNSELHSASQFTHTHTSSFRNQIPVDTNQQKEEGEPKGGEALPAVALSLSHPLV